MNIAVENNIPVWLQQLQSVVNAALKLDEETLIALSALEGKVIGFEFTNTSLILYLFPSGNGIIFDVQYADKPDVLIKGSPFNFIMMLSSAKTKNTHLPSDMQLTGNIGLAQEFQSIMQSLELDLEEPLSKWIGDSAAYQLGRFLKRGKEFAFNSSSVLLRDISEYLRFETEIVPDDLLIEEFCRDVDVLRDDVDRLTQRINKLDTRLHIQEGVKE